MDKKIRVVISIGGGGVFDCFDFQKAKCPPKIISIFTFESLKSSLIIGGLRIDYLNENLF